MKIKWIYLVRFRKVENDKYYYRAFTSRSKAYDFEYEKENDNLSEYDNIGTQRIKLE